ncbi:MAG TPA: ABC transporter ATP-binding protein [Casimicrobiaceae bacterium]|nr:ABC transporter ATP-binding protein [Casimicrobiaceae bacterium]
MLKVERIRVSYQRVPALHDVSLLLKRGEIVAIVGGNGNGKSTTLRAIAGLNRLDAGRIVLADRDIGTLAPHDRVRLGISLVPEGRRLFPRLTVARNLELGAFTRADSAEVAASLDRVFALFPVLQERRRQLAGTMSGGEQQMLAIGRGLMAHPQLLLLDEPSWGIAPKLVTKILDTIVAINAAGVSILLVEQNLRRALAISHRAYVIQTGRMVLEGSGQDLLESELVKQAYLGG